MFPFVWGGEASAIGMCVAALEFILHGVMKTI